VISDSFNSQRDSLPRTLERSKTSVTFCSDLFQGFFPFLFKTYRHHIGDEQAVSAVADFRLCSAARLDSWVISRQRARSSLNPMCFSAQEPWLPLETGSRSHSSSAGALPAARASDAEGSLMNCSGDKSFALAFRTNLYLNLHMCIFCVALKKRIRRVLKSRSTKGERIRLLGYFVWISQRTLKCRVEDNPDGSSVA